MRFKSGRKAMPSVAFTKTLNVGVSPVLIVRVTIDAGAVGLIHWAEASVSQSENDTGKVLAAPVSIETLMVSLAPTLTAATAKAPAPVAGSILTLSLIHI